MIPMVLNGFSHLWGRVKHALYFIHPTKCGVFQLLVALVREDVIDHCGNHGMWVFHFMTLRVGQLENEPIIKGWYFVCNPTLNSTPLLSAISVLKWLTSFAMVEISCGLFGCLLHLKYSFFLTFAKRRRTKNMYRKIVKLMFLNFKII